MAQTGGDLSGARGFYPGRCPLGDRLHLLRGLLHQAISGGTDGKALDALLQGAVEGVRLVEAGVVVRSKWGGDWK